MPATAQYAALRYLTRLAAAAGTPEASGAADAAAMENPASLLIVMVVVVFLILGILVVLVSLVGRLFVAVEKRKKGPKGHSGAGTSGSSGGSAPSAPAGEPALQQAAVLAPGEDDSEVVAAIMAALAAFESETGTRGVIRSITRARSGEPSSRARSAWTQAGVAQNVAPFVG